MNAVIATSALAIAAAFVSMPIVRSRYGKPAMARAEAELARQGVRTSVLRENGMRFDASGHESAAPISIAAIMIGLAGLNVAGADLARPLNWILLTLVLLGNGVILYSNLTAVQSVRAAFAKKGDPMLARIDVPALLKEAEAGFPDWTWTLQNVRHVLVFGGAALGLILTALI
ncbi:hypothetical protein ACWDOP_09565 [Nocardia sp. NPDC003693]